MDRFMRMFIRAVALSSMLVVMVPLVLAQPKTIRVPQDQPTIQEAIDAAVNGDTVLVDEGTYFVNLLLKKKITLASRFLVDGDPAHIHRTILDGSAPRSSDSGSVIIVTGATDSTTVITGFTIRKGSGTRTYDPSVSRYWRGSGGIALFGGSMKVTHNVIRENRIESTTDGTWGGGIGMGPATGTDGTPLTYWVIEDNVIAANILGTATTTTVGAEGAGAWLTEDGRFVRNTVDSNSLSGEYYGRGGGIYISCSGAAWGTSNIFVSGNRIRNNYSKYAGGGVSAFGLSNSRLNLVLTNNLIVNNRAVSVGGGIYVRYGSDVWLINNTIADNSAANSAPGLCVAGNYNTARSFVIGINNIFWNKGSWEEEFWGADIGNFHNNLIRGITALGWNNFSNDPLFLPDGSYRLSPASPAIGAGVAEANVVGARLVAPPTDLLEALRPRASGSAPDLGAIEEDASSSTSPRTQRAVLLSYSHDGYPRQAIVVPPLGHENDRGRPVIIHLHGYDGTADSDLNYMQLYRKADSLRCFTIYPLAYQRRWNSGITRGTNYSTPPVDDVRFISSLIDTLAVRFAIDTNRVLVTGFSNGGFMAFTLAAKLSHKLAGIVAVGARLPETAATGVEAGSPKIPVMIVNGTNDTQVPYTTTYPEWRTVLSSLSFWLGRNGASTTPSTTQLIDITSTDGSSVSKYVYGADLPYDARGIRPQVWFYEIYLGGHEWPGAPAYYGSTVINRDISLNDEIADFFKTTTTGVDDGCMTGGLPADFALDQNYPNPFNPETRIGYRMKEKGNVEVSVMNILGQQVAVLVEGVKEAGYHEAVFGREHGVASMPSGVYFYRLAVTSESGKRFESVRKMVLMK